MSTSNDWSNTKEELTKRLFSENEKDQLEATKAFRNMLSCEQNSLFEAVISTGVITRLVELLKNTTNGDLQVYFL